jgi:hypothetical protein
LFTKHEPFNGKLNELQIKSFAGVAFASPSALMLLSYPKA